MAVHLKQPLLRKSHSRYCHNSAFVKQRGWKWKLGAHHPGWLILGGQPRQISKPWMLDPLLGCAKHTTLFLAASVMKWCFEHLRSLASSGRHLNRLISHRPPTGYQPNASSLYVIWLSFGLVNARFVDPCFVRSNLAVLSPQIALI